MKKTILTQSPVVFKEEEHEYWFGSLQLQGITGMIGRQLFPKKYDNVSHDVLENAKNIGHQIHSLMEMLEKTGINTGSQYEEFYLQQIGTRGLTSLAQEYTVSDLEHFATNIDNVLADENGDIYLMDYKTTYNLDEMYLSWQLSINKHLFLLQNPKLKKRKFHLIALWMKESRNKWEYREVEEIPNEEVKKLLLCEINDELYDNPQVLKQDTQVIIQPQVIEKFVFFEKQAKEAKEMLEKLHEVIREAMEEHGVKALDLDKVKITYIDKKVQKRFDSARFKEEQPDVYEMYQRETEAKASIRVTIR